MGCFTFIWHRPGSAFLRICTYAVNESTCVLIPDIIAQRYQQMSPACSLSCTINGFARPIWSAPMAVYNQPYTHPFSVLCQVSAQGDGFDGNHNVLYVPICSSLTFLLPLSFKLGLTGILLSTRDQYIHTGEGPLDTVRG